MRTIRSMLWGSAVTLLSATQTSAAMVPVPAAAPGIATGPASAHSPAAVHSGGTVTLGEAISLSMAIDPAHAAAAAAVSSARADLMEASGSWLPTLSVSSGYANSSDERFDQATGRLVSESYTAQASAGLLIFSGGRRIFSRQSAVAGLAAAEADYRGRRFAAILATTESFYAAAAASDLQKLAVQRLERARQQLEFARARLDLGTATASDVLRAELELGNAELAVLDAGIELRTSALRLGRRIGVAGEVHPVEGALPDRSPGLPDVRDLVEQALSESPAVISAGELLRARDRDRMRQYGAYLPSLRLSGGYDWFAHDFPPDRRSWSLRLTASLPILDGFQREASMVRAAAFRDLADVRMRDAELAVGVEVEAAVGRIESAEARVAVSDRAVGLAREDLRVLEERYQLGAAAILDLQTSQMALTEAEAAAVRARQELGTAVARLEAILGEFINGGVRE